MRRILRSIGVICVLTGAATSGGAQTLNMMKSIDAPHYDAQRTTWGPTSDVVNMFQDTLVALDWDGRTPVPYLAKHPGINMHMVTNKKVKSGRPHMIYQNTFYKGLDFSF